VFEVAPGVHRIPLPMPNDYLRAVNVYAIEDGQTLTLVDAGVAVAESRQRLEAALAALGCGLPDVARFLVTHIHYDHYSQALSLRDEFGARVLLGREEKPSLSVLADPSIPPLAQQLSLLRRYGAPEIVDAVVAARDGDRSPITGLPDAWLDDDAELEVGGRTLRAVHTPGHTRGHVVFVDDVQEVMFAGDHVLPHITPSIGFEPASAALPLGDYLRSLTRVREAPDRRLLPAHGPVTDSVHERIDELLAHHHQRLDAAGGRVARAAGTAADVAKRLTWTRRDRHLGDLDPFNQMLAVLETGAHLDLLVTQGRLSDTTIDGVLHYTTDAPGPP
jgi:glyoxylase-like metal-dependent hydrolase (beta-lactamase superfamily II)